MRLIDADLMAMKIVKAAELTKFIIGESNVDEVAGALLNIVENEPTVELEDERLISKKPKGRVDNKDTDISSCICPTCGAYAFHGIWNEDVTYCVLCGQAIDWRK